MLLLVIGLVACQPDDASEKASIDPSPPAALHPSEAKPSFDYWVLALSWSPEYCASSEARPNSRQCSQAREFIVHGLWPQYERGYPASCATQTRVSERTADRLADLVPDRGLVFHQWKKHGSCSGMTPEAYFATLERAAHSIVVPGEALRDASNHPVGRVELERQFVRVNPGLMPEAITFECKGPYLREVRVCLDHDLEPRACGPDVNEACGSKPLRVRPARP